MIAVKNVPNILSCIRICLVPVFAVTYFSEPENIKIYATLIYVFASLTDILDGYIARKYHLTSELGKILDPLGDKLMTLTVLTCITIDRVIPIWALSVVLAKELIMVAGGAVIRRKQDGAVPPSNIFGKTSTVVFFIICVTLMLFQNIPENTAMVMISIAIALMMLALASYIKTFITVMRRTDKFNGNA